MTDGAAQGHFVYGQGCAGKGPRRDGQGTDGTRRGGEHFGGLDILVNNAGMAPPTPIMGGAVDDFVRVVMVNQVGVYLGMCQGRLPCPWEVLVGVGRRRCRALRSVTWLRRADGRSTATQLW